MYLATTVALPSVAIASLVVAKKSFREEKSEPGICGISVFKIDDELKISLEEISVSEEDETSLDEKLDEDFSLEEEISTDELEMISAEEFLIFEELELIEDEDSFAEEIFSEEEDFSFSALEELSDDEDFSVSHFTSQTSTMRFFHPRQRTKKNWYRSQRFEFPAAFLGQFPDRLNPHRSSNKIQQSHSM